MSNSSKSLQAEQLVPFVHWVVLKVRLGSYLLDEVVYRKKLGDKVIHAEIVD